MPKRPFEYLTNFYKEKVERDRKTVEYIHTQSDSLITWIIGFSFTGVLLLVSQLDNLKEKTPTKSILICLFACIVLGIVFRYVSYLMTMFQKSLDNYFYGLFSDELMRPIVLEEEIDKMNFDELIRLLKDDFDEGINYSSSLTNEYKQAEEPKLRKHYLTWIEHSKKEFDIGITHLAEIDETAYKIKKEKSLAAIQKTFQNPKIGYNYHLWSKIRGWLYTLCLLSFLTAICILCISLLIMLNK